MSNSFFIIKSNNGYYYKKDKNGKIRINRDGIYDKILPFLKDLDKGDYEVLVKKLKEEHTEKICHHYTFFSLYDHENCCNINSKAIKEMLKPDCIINNSSQEWCNYGESCSKENDKICVYEKNGIRSKEYSAFIYNNTCNVNDTYFFSHSSRIEDNLIWHKFNGNNFLFAINSTNNMIKHLKICVLKEISIITVPVPLNFFLDDKEEIITYIIHKD